MTIRFDDYPYYPALRTRPAEMEGYKELTQQIKKSLLPIVTLGAWPRMDGLGESLAKLQAAVEKRPVILDLTRESAYQNSEVKDLMNSDSNFKAWCEFASRIPNAIPMVQITTDAKQSQIIRQTRQLEGAGLQKIAFRVTDFTNDTPKVINALSAMDSPENALVIIDAGYVRETMAASIAACVSTINDIREEIAETIITVLSTSYPATLTTFIDPSSKGTAGIISLLERDLHQAVGSDASIYGDHSSIHAKVYPTTGGKYTPQIDFPLYDAWAIERRPGMDGNGYVDAASSLISKYPEILEDDSWGTRMIMTAAKGEIDGMKARAKWIAVRVNIHIKKQLELSMATISDEEEDI